MLQKKQDSLGVPKTEPTGETWYSDIDKDKELYLKHNLWQGNNIKAYCTP